MKKLILSMFMVSALFADLSAQDLVMKVWEGVKMPGTATDVPQSLNKYGEPINISTPTLSLYKAKSDKPTIAVLVCPGGGYRNMCIIHEGSEIVKWLNSCGITAVMLQYRTPDNRMGAFQDAQRAMRIIRSKAKEWNIDPSKIGMLGFSAGGHLTARTATAFKQNSYEPIDATDKISPRPDFAVLVYPAYLSADKDFSIVPETPVSADTPPVFITQALDDPYVDAAFAFILAAKRAGVKADMHLYAEGKHGKGVRRTEEPMRDWPMLCEEWIKFYFGSPMPFTYDKTERK